MPNVLMEIHANGDHILYNLVFMFRLPPLEVEQTGSPLDKSSSSSLSPRTDVST